jgi:hypothetical protein
MHNIRLDSPSFFCTTSSTTTNFILDNLVANHLGHLKSGRTTACEALIAQRPSGQRPSFFCTTSSNSDLTSFGCICGNPQQQPEERPNHRACEAWLRRVRRGQRPTFNLHHPTGS